MNKVAEPPYILLPFNFMRLVEGRVLIVNMAGEYLSLSDADFKKIVTHRMASASEVYSVLKAKHLIAESLTESGIDLLATKLRTKKSFLNEFTSLHMFVVTLRCNQKCLYCHASSVSSTDSGSYDMNIETAQKAVDICLKSPARSIKIEFQGGEPLLNFETIKFIVDYASKKATRDGRNIEFVLCSNLTMITDDMLAFLSENNVTLSTSLDGPAHVHNYNRRYRNGGGTYDDVMEGLERARKVLGSNKVSALMTTTRYSLDHAHDIVDEYVSRGFRTMFVRSLNPFGFARQNVYELGYSVSDFIKFYKDLLEYVISVNLRGQFLEEAFTSILLTRILTPFGTGFVDLQFPAGTGISGVIYNYDGNVYLSDEARMLAKMGDNSFCMGNVHKNDFKELFYNNKIRDLIDNTCAEGLPDCCDCAFQAYCGIDPVRNFVTDGDVIGRMPSNESCLINKEIIKYLFQPILSNDRERLNVFWSWLTGRRLSEPGDILS